MGAVQIRIIVPTKDKAGRKTSELMLGQDMVQKNKRQELITITQEGIEMAQTIEQLQAKNAELEKEVERLKVESRDACMGLSDYYGLKLAAEQLNNKLLREALLTCNGVVTQAGEGIVDIKQSYDAKLILEALSIPASREALDKYVAEKVKELQTELETERLRLASREALDAYVAERIEQSGNASLAVRQMKEIASLRKQRDLAVEALKSINKITGDAGFNIGGPLEHCPGQIDHEESKRLLSLACEYLKDTSKEAGRALAAIKESEV